VSKEQSDYIPRPTHQELERARWEKMRNGCPIWKMRLAKFGNACPHFYYFHETGVMPTACSIDRCMGRYWGWR
jgi:hypothetical protein